MKVFIPHSNVKNIYFEEIIRFSKCEFVFGDFGDYTNQYDIVNIQFPEAIFNWEVPSKEQLEELNQALNFWKKYSKVVFLLNDISSHYDDKGDFEDLFQLIFSNVNAVIHLGNYSMNEYKSFFSESCVQTVIYHPLYESLLGFSLSGDFQRAYKVNLDKKYVVSVIGSIRSLEEVKLMFKIFKKIPKKNKMLIVPQMISFTQLPSYWPYRFRAVYKKVAEFIFCFPLLKKDYFFGFKFIDYGHLADLLKKTDVLIIPRIRNLNSGNLFLGLTFDKPMIIPKTGNLTETADYFNFPLLDLQKKNYREVIDAAMALNQIAFFKTKDYLEKKERFKTSTIAKQYDAFFYKLINN